MLSFANSVGNLFNRLGKLGALIANVRTHQTTQLQAMTNTTTGVVAQYNAESDIQALMGSSYIGVLGGVEGVCPLTQNIAVSTINRMVFRDNPGFAQTLQSVNTISSINEVIRQMRIQGATVLAQTITTTPSTGGSGGGSFTGSGDGIINSSFKRPVDGLVLENAYAEKLLFTCSSDSYTGGSTALNEPFSVTGTGAETDIFAFDWPLGSNASSRVNAIDGATSNGSGNILTNSSFNTWSSNVPTGWVLTAGVAGTNISQNSGISFGTGSSLQLTGDAGGTLTSFQQQFNSSNGTLGTISPLTQYSFAIWLRRDGVAAGAGTLTVDLCDQNGNVVNDQGGSANTVSFDLTTLSTNFVGFVGAFRTPEILPTSVNLRIHLSVALTNGRSVYLDKAGLGLMNQAYIGGPFISVHSGSAPFSTGDYGTATVTNSRGSGGTLVTWQTLLFRLFNSLAVSNEILWPSSAIPTISDALIA